MPRNGTGTYSLPQSPFVAGTTISSTAVNSNFSDIATALTQSLPRDGQAGMSGQFKAIDGSVAVPSISFNNEEDSGFYLPSAGVIGVVIGGVEVGRFTSGGLEALIPIGTIVDFSGSSAPSQWLLCYGQAISRTTYADLFAVIGGTYGSGDGSTTFNVPDLRGRLSFGKDDMGGSASSRLTSSFFGTVPTVLGNVGGSQSRTLVTAQLPAYTPSGTISITDGTITVSGGTSGRAVAGDNNNNGGGGGAFSAMSSTALSLTASQTGTTGTFTGAAQGGLATPFALIPPAIIFNKIIFAGA